MSEDIGQERLALFGSLAIFASLLALILVSLLIEYLVDGSDSKHLFHFFEFSTDGTFFLPPKIKQNNGYFFEKCAATRNKLFCRKSFCNSFATM